MPAALKQSWSLSSWMSYEANLATSHQLEAYRLHMCSVTVRDPQPPACTWTRGRYSSAAELRAHLRMRELATSCGRSWTRDHPAKHFSMWCNHPLSSSGRQCLVLLR
eukprot:jgi/Botrbrau1/13854/Bobra.0056s0089.1